MEEGAAVPSGGAAALRAPVPAERRSPAARAERDLWSRAGCGVTAAAVKRRAGFHTLI